MATWNICYNWVLDNEDFERTYESNPDAPGQWKTDANGHKVWDGAYAISGINSAAYPTQFATINNLPQNKRGPAVETFYKTYFWNYWLSQLLADDVAKRVFDAEVNMGARVGGKLLQQACNTLTPPNEVALTIDGVLGEGTISRANSLNKDQLVGAYKAARAKYYEDIIAAHPAYEKYRKGWTARATK